MEARSATRRPTSARALARLITTVLLPEPPLRLPTTTTCPAIPDDPKAAPAGARAALGGANRRSSAISTPSGRITPDLARGHPAHLLREGKALNAGRAWRARRGRDAPPIRPARTSSLPQCGARPRLSRPRRILGTRARQQHL